MNKITSGMVFVPAFAFVDNPERDYANDYSQNYMGSIGIGDTPHANHDFNPNAELIMELAGPRNSFSGHGRIMRTGTDTFLDNTMDANMIKTPGGAGSNPGIWIDVETAEALGIIPKTSVPPMYNPAPVAQVIHNTPIEPMNAQRAAQNRIEHNSLTIAASRNTGQTQKKKHVASISSRRRRRMALRPSY